jgi:hypothetical protein
VDHATPAKGAICRAVADLRDPKFLRDVQLLAAPDDVRLHQAAMQALRAMRSKSSVPYLIEALDDKDRLVRYLSVMGLAETLGRGEGWAPSVDVFGQDEQAYLTRWKNWWNDEGMRLYAPGTLPTVPLPEGNSGSQSSKAPVEPGAQPAPPTP